MLKRFVSDPLILRAAQAVGAAIFALIVAYLARRTGIRLLSEAAIHWYAASARSSSERRINEHAYL
jgi:hypothetical protein